MRGNAVSLSGAKASAVAEMKGMERRLSCEEIMSFTLACLILRTYIVKWFILTYFTFCGCN